MFLTIKPKLFALYMNHLGLKLKVFICFIRLTSNSLRESDSFGVNISDLVYFLGGCSPICLSKPCDFLGPVESGSGDIAFQKLQNSDDLFEH